MRGVWGLWTGRLDWREGLKGGKRRSLREAHNGGGIGWRRQLRGVGRLSGSFCDDERETTELSAP
jgi:hypothetical protein